MDGHGLVTGILKNAVERVVIRKYRDRTNYWGRYRNLFSGLMIARGFASNGAKVYITGRHLEVLQQAARQNFEGLGEIYPIRMDVTLKEDILSVVDNIKKTDGKLDILVNNAAIDGPKLRSSFTDEAKPKTQSFAEYGRELFDVQSFEDWGTVAQVNVAAYFFVTMAFLELLVASTKGKEDSTATVINVTSGGGTYKLSLGYFAYACLKAAATHLTMQIATDFSLKQIPVRVNAIAPGIFPSRLTTSSQEELEEYTKTPMSYLSPIPRRRPGREHEMVALAVYLASDASGYTHGQEIFIDGGLLGVNP
ncbi:short-chain dehydrogenase [Pyrrhoderma noxium]|uniref:Short-chain dehydrogenase n=1 Tax=Pyrrhoderma noxium TaxID=2282107 RepID=A0A286UHR6_9AGAM|nr:short-chain dehydrogenase [Pyrrhoderma noxium]